MHIYVHNWDIHSVYLDHDTSQVDIYIYYLY